MTAFTDTKIDAILRNLGLSTKEARVYTECLTAGEIGITRLAKESGTSRSTTYFITDRLLKKGLIRFIQKGPHRIYSAEDPRKLLALLEKQKDVLEKRSSYLAHSLPELMMHFSAMPHKPVVSYYQGQGEVRQILEDILISGAQEECWVGQTETLETAVGEKFLKDWIKRRVKKSISSVAVRCRSKEVAGEKLYEPSSKYLRKVRFAPESFESPELILFYGNKVGFISSIEESYGVLIESKDLATTMRSWFDILWQQSSPIKGGRPKKRIKKTLLA